MITKKNITQVLSIFALVFIAGGIAFAADVFNQPAANFPGGNAETPLNVSTQDQIKDGNLGAASVTGYNLKGSSQVCIGGDCRSSWPVGGGSDLGVTCKIDTKLYNVNPHTRGNGELRVEHLGQNCDGRLTQADKDAGWFVTSFDECSGVQGRDCTGEPYCQYARISCTSDFGSLNFVRGDFERSGGGSNNNGNGNGNGNGGSGGNNELVPNEE